MKKSPTTPLDGRKQSILKAVVTDYVHTAEPVGSQMLMIRHAFGVKSATIRNELAELAELGYLRQPYTSAGRVPSDLGYRFYVDRLMEAIALSSAEAETAKDKLVQRKAEMDAILEHTCRVLSSLAHYTSLATHPTVKETIIKHISVAAVGYGKLLAVIVLDNGGVLHELLEFDAKPRKLDPLVATNFLSQALVGRSLASLSVESAAAVPEDMAEMKDLLDKILRIAGRELESKEELDIHLEGTAYIMQQPEFKDVERLEAILSILEERGAMYKLFSSIYLSPEATVIIGSENPLAQMRDCSFVGTKYRINGRVAGTIGIVGPTRMDYRRAVAAVEFMARNLEDLLFHLSVS